MTTSNANTQALKAAATELNDKIEATLNEALKPESNVNDDLIKTAEAKKALPGKPFMDANQNMIGALIGATAAVALEVMSPTGSKVSATMAALGAGATAYYCRDLIQKAPQNFELAATTGLIVGYVGMCAGRIGANYFPGNLED